MALACLIIIILFTVAFSTSLYLQNLMGYVIYKRSAKTYKRKFLIEHDSQTDIT